MKKSKKHEICPNCGPWQVEDPRMLREQIRVGDVAFQHLFCTSKGKPLPDWTVEGLPNMYRTLEEIRALRATITTQSAKIEYLEKENGKLYSELKREWAKNGYCG